MFGKEHVVLVIIVNFKVLGMVLSDVCVYKYVYTFIYIYIYKMHFSGMVFGLVLNFSLTVPV